MAEATSKRTKAAVVKKTTINHVAGFLEDLPDKPKRELSLKEAMKELQDVIRAALMKGYSYADLSELLLEQGIKISAFTLKSYVPAGRRQITQVKPRRSKKNRLPETTTDAIAIANPATKASSTSKSGTQTAAKRTSTESSRSATSKATGTKNVTTSGRTASRRKKAE
jgi:hypothetical protein